MWTAPPPEEKDRLLREHAHRFPLPVRIPVRGDGGAPLSLTFLLGNPTGSQRAPSGPVSEAFAHMLGAYLLSKTDEGDDDEVVRDCVLWPDPGQLAAARNRWPRLPLDISKEVMRKVGLIDLPADATDDADLPEPIRAALGAHPRSVVRRFSPPGDGGKAHALLLVIDTPGRVQYDAFTEAIFRRDADRVKLAREYAEGLVLAVDGAQSFAAACDRWPALLVWAGRVASGLAGAHGEVHLGEW